MQEKEPKFDSKQKKQEASQEDMLFSISTEELCEKRVDPDKYLLKAENELEETRENIYQKYQQKDLSWPELTVLEDRAHKAGEANYAFRALQNTLDRIIEADALAKILRVEDTKDVNDPNYAYHFLRRRILSTASEYAEKAGVRFRMDYKIISSKNTPIAENELLSLEEIKPLFESNFAVPQAGSVKRSADDYQWWELQKHGVIGKIYSCST